MQWRAREDYSRLRRSPFGLVQLALHDSAAARLSNDLFICREFECVVRNKKGSPCLESLSAMAGPGRLFAAARLPPFGAGAAYAAPFNRAARGCRTTCLFVGSSNASLETKKALRVWRASLLWRAREDSNSRPCGS